MTETVTNSEATPTPVTPTPEMVSKESYDEVSADMHKNKSEVARLTKQIAESENAKLESTQQFEKLWKTEKARADELESDNSNLKESFLFNNKMNAIKTEAAKAGIRDMSDIELFKFDDVQVQKTTREDGKTLLSVTGAESAIERIKASKPYLFKEVGAPKINAGDPQVIGSGDKITAQQVSKAVGTPQYEPLLAKFKQQRS